MDSSISGYAYIATSEGLARSYAGASASLLEMEWIAKYGVDDLVWFEGYSDIMLAQVRADELAALSEEQRRGLVLRGNPTQADLSSRIWSSEEKQV
jgi:hypothetical protein